VLRLLPLFAGIAPLVAMFGAFWLGVANDVVPSCIPFVDGCVSISGTGRRPPGSFLFRAIMLPQAALLVFVWYFTVLWLRSLIPDLRRSTIAMILVSGLVGAIALVVYVTFLGTKEPIYEFMRRIGIYFGFLGLALAQLFTAIALVRNTRILDDSRLVTLARILLTICLTCFALGALNMILKSILDDTDALENRFEWIVAILMQCYFVVLYFAWRCSGFAAVVTTRNH